MRTGLAEVPDQEILGLRTQIRGGAQTQAVHLCRRRRADAVEPADIEVFDESRTHRRGDRELAVGLAVIGGQFRQKLIVRNARRGGQLGSFQDGRADFAGDPRRLRDGFAVGGHVEIGLVQRQRLHQGRVLGEDTANLLRNRAVDLEARRHEDQVRAQTPRGHGRHRRTDAEFAGFVAGGGDDAAFPGAPDRDRTPAQGGIVALLHRGEERVHIDVDDLPAVRIAAIAFGVGYACRIRHRDFPCALRDDGWSAILTRS